MSSQRFDVTISFKRIQTFLFTVPRLKAMLGANALLGGVLRKDLTNLAKENGAGESGLKYSYAGHELGIVDPLRIALAESEETLLEDSPELLYRNGILVRDGGRFQCRFPSNEKRAKFIDEAIEVIERSLPGIRYDIDPKPHADQKKSLSFGHQPIRLPHFKICEDTGSDVAVTHQKYNENKKKHYVGKKVLFLEKAGGEFYQKKTYDIIGLLDNQLPLNALERAPDFEKLSGNSGYIALIHADGNSIGNRLRILLGENGSNQKSSNELQHESDIESFFHSMRVAIRKATVDALNKTYPEDGSGVDYKYRPYELLMLGGDDVLLLCRPEHAFDFAVNLASEIKKYKIPFQRAEDSENGSKEISMGIGIAIAKRNVPFYLLHELVEQLAGNAKRLYREYPGEHSVVDWNLATTSWINNVNQHRYKYDLTTQKNKETEKIEKWCSLSRPLFVLNDTPCETSSLQQLLECAKKIKNGFDNNQLSRSKFKEVIHLMLDAKSQEAQKHYKTHIEKKLEDDKQSPVLVELNKLFTQGDIWRKIDEEINLSEFRDLMELVEINYLGKLTQESALEGAIND